MGGLLFGLAAYEWVKWRSKTAPGWKVILLIVGGLFLLTVDAVNGQQSWLQSTFELVCIGVGVWAARREMAGVSTGVWKVVLAVLTIFLLADIIVEGGPGPWWQEVKAEFSRAYAAGSANRR